MEDKLNAPTEFIQVEALLRSFLPVPSEDYYRRMASAPWTRPSPANERPRLTRSPQKWVVALAVVLLLIALGFTPSAKVIANQIILFFSRAAGNSLPLPPDQIPEVVPSITPAATYFPALLPATQIVQQVQSPTPRPTPALNPTQYQDLDIMVARALVDFSLLEPGYLPDGYRLRRIQYLPEQQAVSLEYASKAAGSGEFFSITQGKALPPFEVGADTPVENVSARGKQIELVRGGWFTPNGASESTWESESETYTLRWQENGVTVSILFFLNDTFYPAYIPRDQMLNIVAGLSACPTATPDKDYACEVNRAAVAAGFTPWQFPQAPQGYTFKLVDYKPGLTAIWYSSAGGELGILQSENDFLGQESASWDAVPAEAIQTLSVAGQPAEYVNGSFIIENGSAQATWAANNGQVRLRWQKEPFWFQAIQWGRPELAPQTLADLLGQLQPGSAPAAAQEQNQTAPGMVGDAYLDLDQAVKAYGKEVLRPAVLPEGLPFSHARLTENGIMIFYGSYAADKIHSNGAGMLLVQGIRKPSPPSDIGYGDYPPEAIETVDVNGVTATLISGMLEVGFDQNGNPQGKPVWRAEPFTLSLSWETADRYTSLQFFSGSGSGARISRQGLIDIAESLQ